MNKKLYFAFFLLFALILSACQGGKVTGGGEEGDTLSLKYSQLLTLVDCDGYTEAIIANPWKEGTELHRYVLIPKGEEGDETARMLQKRRDAKSGLGRNADIIRTPIASSVISTAPHCQLLYELGCQEAITGVFDLDYINIPDIQKRAASMRGKEVKGRPSNHAIVDCGSSMQPTIERVIALHPEAVLVSPFENSGGYGKLDKLGVPLIEAADYMETSPLGRSEWIRFYGLLFGRVERRVKSEEFNSPVGNGKADSLFTAIEKEYLSLKDEAAKMPQGLSVLTERKTGGVWYVPGGRSTVGVLLRDAHAGYAFAGDTHNGSLAMNPEQVAARGSEIEVWAFKYLGGKPLSRPDLLQEYPGYKLLRAFANRNIYECDTQATPYFETASFHPEMLLREFIILSHPNVKGLGSLRFYQKLSITDNL